MQLVLVEAKPGIDVASGDLLQESEIVPLKTIRRAVDLPPGQHDVEVGFAVDSGSHLGWRFQFPNLPDLDVESGFVTDGDAEEEGTDNPLDIVLLLDTSSSMRGEKLRACQNASHNLLAQVSLLDTRVGLGQFGRHTKILSEVGTPLNDIGDAIESLVACGGTPMGDALRLGTQHLAAFALDGREQLVLLVTDGHPNDVPEAEEAATIVKTTATLICVGIGNDVSQQLLLALSTTPQHCFFADSAGDIANVFHQIIELYLKS